MNKPKNNHFKHGLVWNSDGKMRPVYTLWLNMKNRCRNKKLYSYQHYGKRGIKVCEEWKDNYLAFHKWAMDTGYKKGLTIERIDNDKGYSPDNCKWATRKEQANNRRSNRIINYNGGKYTLSKLAEKIGMNYGTLFCRLERGWSIKDAVGLPLDNRGGIH